MVACAFNGNAFQVVQALTALVSIRWCLDAAHFAHFIDLLEQAPGRYLFVIGCASEGDEQGDGVIVVVVEYREEDLRRIFPRTWRTRQTLWRAVQMLTQKLCCQTIHDCPKVVPLHYESEWQ